MKRFIAALLLVVFSFCTVGCSTNDVTTINEELAKTKDELAKIKIELEQANNELKNYEAKNEADANMLDVDLAATDDSEQDTGNIKVIAIGDIITVDGICEFSVVKTEFSEVILTTNKTIPLSYKYEVSDGSVVFIDSILSVKNLSDDRADVGDMLKVKYIYNGRYEYDFILEGVETEDSLDFERGKQIYSLANRNTHHFTEIRKEESADTKPLEMVITCGGKDYRFGIK